MDEVEYLMALTGTDPHGSPSLEHVRTLSSNEVSALHGAESLLVRLTTRSEFAEVRATADTFADEVGRLESAIQLAAEVGAVGNRLERSFKAWLSSVKSFDERTRLWLTQVAGHQSDPYRQFVAALSVEFDRNFAYRLACALRNVAEHARTVLNDVHYSDELDLATNDVGRRIVIRINSKQLAADAPRLRAATRKEMKSVDGSLEVRWIVESATLSCQNVHAHLLLAMWDRVQPALELLDGFQEEAILYGGTSAAFLVTKPGAHGEYQLRPGPYAHAELIRKNRAQADAMAAMPPQEWSAHSFTAE